MIRKLFKNAIRIINIVHTGFIPLKKSMNISNIQSRSCDIFAISNKTKSHENDSPVCRFLAAMTHAVEEVDDETYENRKEISRWRLTRYGWAAFLNCCSRKAFSEAIWSNMIRKMRIRKWLLFTEEHPHEESIPGTDWQFHHQVDVDQHTYARQERNQWDLHREKKCTSY